MKTPVHGQNAGKARAGWMAAGMCLAVVILVLTVIFIKGRKPDQRNEVAEIFSDYARFGLVYDIPADRLYYQGELVRYFEDISDENRYMIWPQRDGAVDVYAVRGASGGLAGVKPFDAQAFLERTDSLQYADCELQITEDIDGYTSEAEDRVDQLVKDRIEAAYAEYEQYGLRYDRETERLYYNGRLVGAFEDRLPESTRSFGPYADSGLVVKAVRDSKGNLTGLDVSGEGE